MVSAGGPRPVPDGVAASDQEAAPPPAPDGVAADDHLLARWAASSAGALLMRIRAEGLQGQELKDRGDRASHEYLIRLLAEHRRGDAVLSEEGKDDRARLTAKRVWIIDPVDGTREFSEPPRVDWAVHVALWEDGELAAGAVSQPALGETFSTGEPSAVPPRGSEGLHLAVSRTRPPEFVAALAEEIGATLVPMGSAGVKMISVVRGVTDAYVHAGGQYEWDSAAPVAVARCAGLHASRVDGSALRYNRDDVLLPDVLVCRPEFAEPIIQFVNRLQAPAS
jgi:3'(2'), 5'-bisphosphate nucleotidase